MRQRLFLVALLCLNASTAYASEDVNITLDFLTTLRGQGVRDGLVNQGNRLRQPSALAETALVAEGDVHDVHFRVRAPIEADYADPKTGDQDWDVGHDPVLQDLATTVDLDDDAFLTVGKTTLPWDVAYAAHPLGFFQKEVDLGDIEDRRRLTEGLPLAALNLVGDGWDLSVVAAKDFGTTRDGYQRGLTQWAARYGMQLGATSVAAVLQQPENERLGLGGSVTHVIGNALELHGSVFARQGTRRPIHSSVLTGDLRYYAASEDPVGEWRRDDGRWFPRWVVGGQWTSRSFVNVIAEWVHDSQGLSDRQWDTLRHLARFHAAGAPVVPARAIEGNLAHDARTFLIDTVRQDYLFLRVVQGGGDWEPSFAAMVGAADGSASLNARLAYMGGKTWEAWLDARANVGPPDSEFRSVPQAGFLGATVRFIF